MLQMNIRLVGSNHNYLIGINEEISFLIKAEVLDFSHSQRGVLQRRVGRKDRV